MLSRGRTVWPAPARRRRVTYRAAPAEFRILPVARNRTSRLRTLDMVLRSLLAGLLRMTAGLRAFPEGPGGAKRSRCTSLIVRDAQRALPRDSCDVSGRTP